MWSPKYCKVSYSDNKFSIGKCDASAPPADNVCKFSSIYDMNKSIVGNLQDIPKFEEAVKEGKCFVKQQCDDPLHQYLEGIGTAPQVCEDAKMVCDTLFAEDGSCMNCVSHFMGKTC